MIGRVIILTDDDRMVTATVGQRNPVTISDDLKPWIDQLYQPISFDGYLLTAVSKAESDVVSPREVKAAIMDAINNDEAVLNELMIDMINNSDGAVKPDGDLYDRAIAYAAAYLDICGLLESCYLYNSDELVGYRLQLEGKIAAEVVFGTEPSVEINA